MLPKVHVGSATAALKRNGDRDVASKSPASPQITIDFDQFRGNGIAQCNDVNLCIVWDAAPIPHAERLRLAVSDCRATRSESGLSKAFRSTAP